jgi:hypothetical protein
MSVTYNDVARVTREVDQVTCDLCGAEAARGNTWPVDSFAIDEITIMRKTGRSAGSFGEINEEKVDVCPDCWVSKVVPFFEGLGAKFRGEGVQW